MAAHGDIPQFFRLNVYNGLLMSGVECDTDVQERLLTTFILNEARAAGGLTFNLRTGLGRRTRRTALLGTAAVHRLAHLVQELLLRDTTGGHL